MPKPSVALMIGAPKEDTSKDTKKGEFKAPADLDMEGKKPGDMIEVVATCEVKDDGMLCVRKVNGMDVEGYDDEAAPAEKEPYQGGFADAVMTGSGAGEEEGAE